MNKHNKKLTLTQRGKITLSVTVAASIVILGLLGYYLISENSKTNVDSAAIYSYSVNYMLEESKNNENEARDNLREKIEESDKLIKDSDGKVFDGSRANLEVYLSNIREIPDSQIVESDNIIDYVNSEKRINGFLSSLTEKHNALQSSYDNWTKKREGLDKTQETLQEEISQGSLTVTELEELLAEKKQQGSDAATDREALREELEKRYAEQNRNNTPVNKPTVPVAKPTTPVEKPTPTKAPVEKPTQKEPTKPTVPPKTTKPVTPTTPPKTTKPVPPTSTPVPTTPPVDTETPEDNEALFNNADNERD